MTSPASEPPPCYEGGCQCGRVRYRADGPRGRTSLCFCRMCQKAGGAPFMAFVRFPASKVSWSRPPKTFASSETAERGFCPECGTPLTYRRIEGGHVSVTLASLDRPEDVEPELTFFVEGKAAWIEGIARLPNQPFPIAPSIEEASRQGSR